MTLTLIRRIQDAGDKEVARRCGVRPRTVAAWRRGECRPRPGAAAKLVKMFPGVSYRDVYADK